MMFQLPLTIETLTSVVLAQSSGPNIMATTEEFFSGAVVRGVLAGRYLSGKNLAHAEQDPTFYDLFLSGKVTFGPAYPMLNGDTGEFLPLCLMRDKDYSKICDLTHEAAEAGLKGLRGLGVVNNEQRITILSAKKNLEMHMSRQRDQERITGSSIDGQIYNYESLAAGQKFQSYLIGSKEDLQKILAAFPDLQDGQIIYVGRSKHTQYGKCRIKLGTVQECNLLYPGMVRHEVDGNGDKLHKIAIKFATDFIPQNTCFGSAQEALQDLAVSLERVEFGQIFSMVGTQEGFVGIWGTKRELRRSLKSGSVVELVKRNEEWTGDDLLKLLELGQCGVGLRTIDGFGRFHLYDYRAPQDPFVENDKELESPKEYAKYSEEVEHIVKKVLWAELVERLQKIAVADRDERLENVTSGKHIFVRLEKLINDGKNLFEEIGDESKAANTLRSLKGKNNISLYEILCEKRRAPYQERWNEVITEEMQSLANEVDLKLPNSDDVEVYKTYWRWFCRMARKKVVENERKGVGR